MRDSPYVGLMPYREEDHPFFRGRDEECAIIIANLMASRLTLLYGPGGVGKSSVLNAGVVYQLRQQAGQNLKRRGIPRLAVVPFRDWSGNPVEALKEEARKSVARVMGGQEVKLTVPSASFTHTLQAWTERVGGDLLIILDQFEEYFQYHVQEDGEGTFAYEFPRAVNSPDLRVKFLISIREDSLARLDRFEGQIPNLFANYLRLDHLSREGARAAIQEPIEQYNLLQSGTGLKFEVEPALVEAVLDQVKTGQVVVGEAGRGVVRTEISETPAGMRIETAYLQLVMNRLWERERELKSCVLRLQTLEDLGGAESIVKTHLDKTMDNLPLDEQEAAASVFHYLVTPSGTKIAQTLADLANYGNVEVSALGPLLQKLSRQETRIVRPVDPPLDRPMALRYEIFHDVLAPAILDWRARHVEARRKAQEADKAAKDAAEREREAVRQRELEQAQALATEQARRAKEQTRAAARQRRLVAVLAALFLLAVGLAVVAAKRGKEAMQAAIIAQTAKDQAEKERHEAEAARRRAEAAKADADELRKQADAHAKTDEGLKNRALVEKHAADVAKEKAVIAANLEAAARKTAEDERERANQQAKLATAKALEADAARKQAQAAMHQANESRLLVTTAGNNSDNLDLALLLSLEANRISDTPEVKGTLLTSLASSPYLTTFLHPGQTGAVRSVAFSPDGKTLASASVDGSIVLCNASGWRLGAPLVGHKGAVYSVAFSPDGRMLASGGADGTIRLWEVETGQPLGKFGTVPGTVYSVAFSPQGNSLASASKDGTIVLWEVPNPPDASSHIQPRWTRKGHQGAAYAVAFSPEGKMLASGGADKTIILWNVATGKPVPGSPLTGHGDEVFTIAFSPDGKTLASGSSDFTVMLWDTTTLKPLYAPLKGHLNSVFSVAFSPDGKILASASTDKSILLWDAHTGKRIGHDLTGHTDSMYSVAFAPGTGATTLASGGADGTITLWDDPPRKWLGRPLRHSEWVTRVAFSPKGDLLASSGAGLILWDAVNSKALDPALLPRSEAVGGVAFSPDGQMLASGSRDGKITLWNVSQRQALPERLGDDATEVSSLTFQPALEPDQKAKVLSWGKKDGTIVLWEVDNHRPSGPPLTGHQAAVVSLAFSRDGRTLASGDIDGSVILWDADSRKPLTPALGGHEKGVTCLAFSPDGSTLASGSYDKNIFLWDVKNRQYLAKLTKHRGAVNALEFSPDGKMLASGSDDKTIVLWDVATRRAVGPPLKEQNAAVHGLAFSPDGKTLASGSYMADARDNWPIVLWDVSFDSWQSRACQIADRNLTQEEWGLYLGRELPRVTCPTALLKAADADALTGKAEQALREFRQLVEVDSERNDGDLNNSLCWYGSLDGFANIVEPACERAVELEPENGAIRDSRGVARAMMGPDHYAEAIKDFDFFLKWSKDLDSKAYEEPRRERKAWIERLETRQNPFDSATLRALRRE